jgi:hypothetical protein
MLRRLSDLDAIYEEITAVRILVPNNEKARGHRAIGADA